MRDILVSWNGVVATEMLESRYILYVSPTALTGGYFWEKREEKYIFFNWMRE